MIKNKWSDETFLADFCTNFMKTYKLKIDNDKCNSIQEENQLVKIAFEQEKVDNTCNYKNFLNMSDDEIKLISH